MKIDDAINIRKEMLFISLIENDIIVLLSTPGGVIQKKWQLDIITCIVNGARHD